MQFRVHFVHDGDDCTAEINAVNAESAAKQVRRDYKGAVVKKTKVIRQHAEA